MNKIMSFIQSLMRILKLFLQFCTDFFAGAFAVKNSSPEKRILILNYWHLGDFLMLLAAYKEIRKYFPEHKIYFLTNLDIAGKTSYFDKIFDIDLQRMFFRKGSLPGNIIYRFKSFRKINLYYDYIFNLGRGGNDLTFLAANLKAKNKIGYDQTYVSGIKKTLWKPISKIYTKRVKSGNMHVVWALKDYFLQSIPDYEVQDDKYYLPKLDLPEEEYKSLKNKDYYVIALGSTNKLKNWNLSKFAEFAEKARTETDAIVLAGAKDEISIGRAFEKEYKGKKNIINLIGKTNLTELVSIVGHARFFIGNDTGSSHLAVALSVPSICIVGGSTFNCCFPYFENDDDGISNAKNLCVFEKTDCFNCWYRCVYNVKKGEAYKCLEIITIKQVLEKYEKLKSRFNIK